MSRQPNFTSNEEILRLMYWKFIVFSERGHQCVRQSWLIMWYTFMLKNRECYKGWFPVLVVVNWCKTTHCIMKHKIIHWWIRTFSVSVLCLSLSFSDSGFLHTIISDITVCVFVCVHAWGLWDYECLHFLSMQHVSPCRAPHIMSPATYRSTEVSITNNRHRPQWCGFFFWLLDSDKVSVMCATPLPSLSPTAKQRVTSRMEYIVIHNLWLLLKWRKTDDAAAAGRADIASGGSHIHSIALWAWIQLDPSSMM